MDAGTQTIEKLFHSPKQVFEIPTFQRQYVWDLQSQWEPLWEDVRHMCERYAELLEQTGDRQQAQKDAGRHFLGAVVVQRKDRPFGAPETWELIDGQQRLTTLQLLLQAAYEVYVEMGFGPAAGEFEVVVRNYRCSGDEVFKLWPTGGDQAAFRAVMDHDTDNTPFAGTQIAKAHQFFRTQMAEWLSEGDDVEGRAQQLQVTLLALLELVVIKLDGSDDAFVIFETLNARGTPLLAADLVKNFVLQQAVQQQRDKDAFHAKYWKPFEEEREAGHDRPWWLTEIRQGRIYRPRLDVFLNHWLVMRHQDELKARNLFPAFKRHVETTAPDDIESVVQDFVHVAASYRSLAAWPETSIEGQFLYRWRVVQAGVLTPVLLQLFSAPADVLSAVRRQRALRFLESYLVRRLVCRLTTKDYNRLFLELVRELNGDVAHADDVVEAFLLGQDAHSRVWPTDETVRAAVTTLPLYGRINQSRIRMILEGIEGQMRSANAKAEEHRVPRNLEIEHVMPRSWRDHWPLEEHHDPDAHHRAIQRRETLIHSLGNLTLVTGRLNRSVSNSAWDVKRAELGKHTTLYLNKELLDAVPADSAFDEQAIVDRGERLAGRLCLAWPRREDAVVD